MLDPIIVTKESGLPGDECALCRAPFAPGDLLIECPEDGAHHHTWCWRAHGNRCTAAGCEGSGEIAGWVEEEEGEIADEEDPVNFAEESFDEDEFDEDEEEDDSAESPQPTPLPQTRIPFLLQISQSCLVLAIAIAIIVMTFSCFGLWAILDYVALEVMGWDYRPLTP